MNPAIVLVTFTRTVEPPPELSAAERAIVGKVCGPLPPWLRATVSPPKKDPFAIRVTAERSWQQEYLGEWLDEKPTTRADFRWEIHGRPPPFEPRPLFPGLLFKDVIS